MGLEVKIKERDPRVLLLFWKGTLWKEVRKHLFFKMVSSLPKNLEEKAFFLRFQEEEERLARSYAIRLLSQRSLLSKVLEEKLRLQGISEPVIQKVSSLCQQKGYINDSQEIKRLAAKEAKKGFGKKAILFKLSRKKGVDKAILQECLPSALSEELQLKEVFEKEKKKIDCKNPVARQKLLMKLARRGFSFDAVLSCDFELDV